jgi:hypothetical protein
MLFSDFNWSDTIDALDPEAALFKRDNFSTLIQCLLNFSDDRISKLKGIWCHDFIVLLGRSSELPWLPGVHYYGRHRDAPNVYTPTNRQCDLRYDLIQKLVLNTYPKGSYILEPTSRILIPLLDARVIDRPFLDSLGDQYATP